MLKIQLTFCFFQTLGQKIPLHMDKECLWKSPPIKCQVDRKIFLHEVVQYFCMRILPGLVAYYFSLCVSVQYYAASPVQSRNLEKILIVHSHSQTSVWMENSIQTHMGYKCVGSGLQSQNPILPMWPKTLVLPWNCHLEFASNVFIYILFSPQRGPKVNYSLSAVPLSPSGCPLVSTSGHTQALSTCEQRRTNLARIYSATSRVLASRVSLQLT